MTALQLHNDDLEASTPVKSSIAQRGGSDLSSSGKNLKVKGKSSSNLRKWGPAILAVLAVLGLNAYLLGYDGSKMPSGPSAKTQRRNMLAEQMTAKIESMEYSQAQELRNVQNFHRSRYLSEEEGGVMEYTRRRHRALNEYVHVDVSDDFSTFGKVTVALIYFAFWVFLMVRYLRICLLSHLIIEFHSWIKYLVSKLVLAHWTSRNCVGWWFNDGCLSIYPHKDW